MLLEPARLMSNTMYGNIVKVRKVLLVLVSVLVIWIDEAEI